MNDKIDRDMLAGGKAVRARDWELMRSIVPKGYVCYRAPHPLAVDGTLSDPAWERAPWTEHFADIEGDRRPAPRFKTRAKMLWDDDYFYVGATLQEPHVWGTLTKKNSIIFQDNDFEVFIDPDGDNHNYYEFEINALGTIWELCLPKPYKDGGEPILGTDLDGLKSAVHVAGTLSDPTDEDEGWSVEIAFPWSGLAQYNPGKAAPPQPGDQWRVNFSRVEWRHEITADGRYRKVPKTAEDNWVWSPQGIIDMHRPERWGFVQFSEAEPGTEIYQADPTLPAREMLMEIYHGQHVFRDAKGRFAATLAELHLERLGLRAAKSPAKLVAMELERNGFRATARIPLPGDGKAVIQVDHESRLWRE